jgi:hypothetical protein
MKTKKGVACRAWAVRESDPPLCSAHAGRTVGAGAPNGNVNALKSGIYQKNDSAEEIEEVELATMEDELRLVRKGLKRMNWLLERDDLTPMEYTVVMAQISRGARAVGFLEPKVLAMRHLRALDAVMDDVEREWGIGNSGQ